jgi:hypothetical protein
MLVTLARQGVAQSIVYINPDLHLVGGDRAVNDGDVTHSFVVLRSLGVGAGYDYPRVMNISNYGRVGIGNRLYGGARTMLSVGTGVYNLSVDEVGSPRPKAPGQTDYVTKGGACIGFNAARQSDAAFACDPSEPNGT